ncbi:MAG: protein-ADP-ribose hydrolase [Selenomonadaceae bacterium]|nr:protein-ADP-ribose hydrolase [Selenomonadaceae bacterium]
MNTLERLFYLNEALLQEMPRYQEEAAEFPQNEQGQRRLLRSLMNVRPPRPLSKDFLVEQDKLLQEENNTKGTLHLELIRKEAIVSQSQLLVWQGDITRLAVDAIVNAANSALLGCFVPCHGCIDNAIHSAAGLQLREACAKLMKEQGHEEPTGQAKITSGYNLPSKYVLHTVGPIIHNRNNRGAYSPTDEDARLLASCYRSCLELAEKHHLQSIAFCCISTGEFHYPNQAAAEVAIQTVREWLSETNSSMTVVFNVFKDVDVEIYGSLLNDRAC